MSNENSPRFERILPEKDMTLVPGSPWVQGQQERPLYKPWRSRGAAVVLGVFLGDFGLHNFYLSQFARGAMHLVLLVGGVLMFQYGLRVSAASPATAGIPRGLELYILGLSMIGINSLWRWADVILTLSTDKELFDQK